MANGISINGVICKCANCGSENLTVIINKMFGVEYSAEIAIKCLDCIEKRKLK